MRTRGIHFAYLFGPPRFVRRDDASRIYNAVCEALRHDDFAFRYGASEPATKPSSRGFAITIERREGRGLLKVTLDNASIESPIRLLLSYEWPPSVESVVETFDLASRAVFENVAGERARVMAEARIRAQCDVQGGDAIQFVRTRVLGLSPDWIGALGEPLVLAGAKFEVESSPPTEENPLHGPKRELVVEVLKEDARCVYLELMSQWPVLAVALGGRPDLARARPIGERPSEYVREAHAFLRERVEGLTVDRRAGG